MKPHDEILLTLPQNFSRQDFITKVGAETSYSYPHAQNLLQAAIHEGKITRVERGIYKKCEPELELEVN